MKIEQQTGEINFLKNEVSRLEKEYQIIVIRLQQAEQSTPSSNVNDQRNSEQQQNEEINRLNGEVIVLRQENGEILGHLQRAEEYIFQLQGQMEELSRANESIPENYSQNPAENTKVIQLEQALEQEYKNQQDIKNHYEIQINQLNEHYNIQILELNQKI